MGDGRRVDVYELDLPALEELLAGWGAAREEAREVWAWLYRRGATGFDEMTTLAGALREATAKVRRESSIVTAAAEALSRHMTGIMQTVNSALSRVGVYERRGRIAVGAQMDFCVDLKS